MKTDALDDIGRFVADRSMSECLVRSTVDLSIGICSEIGIAGVPRPAFGSSAVGEDVSVQVDCGHGEIHAQYALLDGEGSGTIHDLDGADDRSASSLVITKTVVVGAVSDADLVDAAIAEMGKVDQVHAVWCVGI
jgi:hypothetical protein